MPAGYKRGVSGYYANPRPLRTAGGNTLYDITATRAHWIQDVAHLPNRLPVRWRQPRPLPFTFSGVGGANSVSTSRTTGGYAVIGCEWWEWTSVAERKPRGGDGTVVTTIRRLRHRRVIWLSKVCNHPVTFSCASAITLFSWIKHVKYDMCQLSRKKPNVLFWNQLLSTAAEGFLLYCRLLRDGTCAMD